MRLFVTAFFLGSLLLAQDPQWRRDLMGLPERPAAGTNVQDVDRFVQNVQLAAPYFATITPGDFEADREMVRRMWAYTMALEMMAKQYPMLRSAANRARGAMNAFPIGYSMVQSPRPASAPSAPSQPQKPAGPPFAMTAPAMDDVPDSARELLSRYESTATRAVAVWQNAETMRRSLAAQGMTLNAQTAASVSRLQGAMESASRSLRARDWAEAGASLDRADGEIAKISKVVGH